MKKSEATLLLIKCAAFDQRTIGEADAQAWAEVLDDIRLSDALDAVAGHYVVSRERIMPLDIRVRVKVLREERLAAAVEPIPPHELVDDPAAYQAWMRQARQQIADGGDHQWHRDPELPERVMPDLSRVFPSMPRPRYSS